MRILFILAIALIISCKPDSGQKGTTGTANTDTAQSQKRDSPRSTGNMSTKNGIANTTTPTKAGKIQTNFNKNGIPDACDLLTQSTIAKYLNIPEASINLADGSSAKNNKQRACFFKWDGSSIKNAGVMVQVQQNQVADDVPEYLTYMVSSLKTDGENNFSDGTKMKYKDFPGFGDDGAYSTEAGKYVWRIGNDWAFMIAFNTTLEAKDQKRAAEAFAKEVMSRMTF